MSGRQISRQGRKLQSDVRQCFVDLIERIKGANQNEGLAAVADMNSQYTGIRFLAFTGSRDKAKAVKLIPKPCDSFKTVSHNRETPGTTCPTTQSPTRNRGNLSIAATVVEWQSS